MEGTSPKDRLAALRRILESGEPSTQEELRDKLEKEKFAVTQSTISRDLRKLGAIRAVDVDQRTVYRLPDEFDPAISRGISGLVLDVKTNGSLIVVQTAVGSASLVARHLDRDQPDGILGTIAGDDTIFVAPAAIGTREVKHTVDAIRKSLSLS